MEGRVWKGLFPRGRERIWTSEQVLRSPCSMTTGGEGHTRGQGTPTGTLHLAMSSEVEFWLCLSLAS